MWAQEVPAVASAATARARRAYFIDLVFVMFVFVVVFKVHLRTLTFSEITDDRKFCKLPNAIGVSLSLRRTGRGRLYQQVL